MAYPFSAKSMAGWRIVAKSTLPEPNHSTVSTQEAAAPGTVIAWTLERGKPWPSTPDCLTISSVNAAGVLQI